MEANVDMCTSFLGRRGLCPHMTQLINTQMQIHARLTSWIPFPHDKLNVDYFSNLGSALFYYYLSVCMNQWVSHRNHRGNICGVDFIWLLNPNGYRRLLKASWSEAIFGMFKVTSSPPILIAVAFNFITIYICNLSVLENNLPARCAYLSLNFHFVVMPNQGHFSRLFFNLIQQMWGINFWTNHLVLPVFLVLRTSLK